MSLLLLRLSGLTKWKQFIQHNMSIYFLASNERMKERKQILPSVAFFNCHFTVLLFEHFSVRVVGDLSEHWTYYTACNHNRCSKCPPTTWTHPSQQHQPYFHKLSVHCPCQMITIIQSDINEETSSLGNGRKSENMLFTFSAPNDLPHNLLKHCNRVWITLYIILVSFHRKHDCHKSLIWDLMV
jgi:hypothetical protein